MPPVQNDFPRVLPFYETHKTNTNTYSKSHLLGEYHRLYSNDSQ